MIITQRDLDEFIEAFGRDCPDDANYETWKNEDMLAWLVHNPQVVIAAGYQEFVAGHSSVLYRSLTSSAELDDFLRPLFRTFDGSWIVPSNVNCRDNEEWEAFNLNGLAEIADEKQRTYEKLNRGEGDSNDHYDAIEHLDRKSVTQSILMPSFSEMVSRASKFVDNPLIDQTTWVSPKLWTPDRQAMEKTHLQQTASAILSEIGTRTRELADLRWQELEEIVAELLRSKGMEISLVRENPQGGRDIIARAELVPGSEVVTIAVEVKHMGVVDRPILQQAIAQNKHFPALMLVTSGRFTAGVIKEAAKAENRLRVFLKDGIAIRDMAKVYRL